MFNSYEPLGSRHFTRRRSTEPPPVAWVYVQDGRRQARCTCEDYRIDQSCRHVWIVALVQASLNRLGLGTTPTFYLDFDSPDDDQTGQSG